MISADSETIEKNNFPSPDHHDMSFRNSWNSDDLNLEHNFSTFEEDHKIIEHMLMAQQASTQERELLKNQLHNTENKNYGDIKEENEEHFQSENPVQIFDDFFSKDRVNQAFSVEFDIKDVNFHDSIKDNYIPVFVDMDKKHEEEKKNNNTKPQLRISYITNKTNIENIEGYLKKESPSLFKRWQKRYCKLSEKKFVYYEDETKKKPLGFLDFDLLSYEIEEKKENNTVIEFKVIPKDCNRVFRFKSCDKKDKDLSKWMNALKNNLLFSEGNKRTLTKLGKVPRFWSNDRLSLKKFKNLADTLDILLFQGKTMMSKLQRSLTGSEFDHVALILRYGNDDLVLLESTGKLGVGLCSWNCFLRNNWQNLYKKLVFRHLELRRTDDLIEKLEKFVKIVIGKKYKVSAKKLLKRKSVAKNEEVEKENYQNTTFFCSELVASAYKVLSLLPKEIASAQYWPGCFSARKKLQLIDCKLSEEYLLDFDIND